MPVEAPRALAFEVLRQTFEHGAHTELAFRAGAERLGLAGRDRAQAQRLAYGSVQRRGTSDAAIERLAGRAMHLLDPQVAAALRLGLYELLFADGTPDHAAVDQAVELVKIAKAAHAAGFINAILRRAAREREQLTESLLGDDSTAEAAAVAHSAPLWLAQMWWEELGAGGGALAARRLQSARRGGDAGERRGGARRPGGAPARRGRRRLAGGRRLAARGRPRSSSSRAGSATRCRRWSPRARSPRRAAARRRWSRCSIRSAGETVLDLCAGPGIKTGQIAPRMGDRGEVISIELDAARAAESRRPGPTASTSTASP